MVTQIFLLTAIEYDILIILLGGGGEGEIEYTNNSMGGGGAITFNRCLRRMPCHVFKTFGVCRAMYFVRHMDIVTNIHTLHECISCATWI